jgi:type VI secretion system protein ImpC
MHNLYQQLCEIANIEPTNQELVLQDYISDETTSNQTKNKRLTAGIKVLLQQTEKYSLPIERVDKVLIDYYISKIDQQLSIGLDKIIHDPKFQKLESLWHCTKQLISNTSHENNIQIEILNCNKKHLLQNFEDSIDITHAFLYQTLYTQEYDMPGGEPFSAIISDFDFSSGAADINLLTYIADVCATAHCPFIGTTNEMFFHKPTMQAVANIEDLENYLSSAEFIQWNHFRQTENSRYIGLTLPRYLLRLPYGYENSVDGFIYLENENTTTENQYLWGKASFAFAINMCQSFSRHGWAVNIRGPESGGILSNLPLHHYDSGLGLVTQLPIEVSIPESRELQFANLGFIPLSYYKNSDYACFFSANSTQKPNIFNSAEATANSRINAKLPYICLSARIGHYLKVMQRENIGSNKNKIELEEELNQWLQTLITKMNHPGPEISATHPLRDGKVVIEEQADNPGYYKVLLYITPHFQIEGIDVNLSLVSQIPKRITQ